jgi:hypothetical protein
MYLGVLIKESLVRLSVLDSEIVDISSPEEPVA